ncbi:TatD family hydrolase [Psychrobacter urativorans]|uniref:TatD family hydrolase n=1 Tax=Psychrobacter urativorans TaxID=45610 RepID=UPI0019187379|nr:TatD family hydrolase [Psychrobacter urativorans]
MTAIDLSLRPNSKLPLLTSIYPLIDTHTHFDAPVFDEDRGLQARQAYEYGVRHLVLVGYLARHFDRLYTIQQAFAQPLQSTMINSTTSITDASVHTDLYPQTHIALGLHPFYIEQHTDTHLEQLAQLLDEQQPLAIGEIGLDAFTNIMKQPEMLAKQQRFFNAQLDMAVRHQLPVMLHIRKAHAEALALLKAHTYNAHKLGGIAHSFSGGEQEAKAFVKLGFKLGVTGQVTNPNAKKLRRAIQAAVEMYGIECLVIETDCPDMTPIMCQTSAGSQSALGQSIDNEWQGAAGHNRNVPGNLPWVLHTLGELLHVAPADLARQLWQNSCDALQVTWAYPEPSVTIE